MYVIKLIYGGYYKGSIRDTDNLEDAATFDRLVVAQKTMSAYIPRGYGKIIKKEELEWGKK